MRNRRRVACLVVFLLSVSFALAQAHQLPAPPIAAQDPKASALDVCLIVELDRYIQERFKDVDRGFGFRRVVTINQTPHRFQPEKAKELEAVSELEKARLQVVLYLAGRSVLGPQPEKGYWESRIPRKMIQGPVLVTAAGQQNNDLPQPSELWEQSRKAMDAFSETDQYDFKLGKWRFAARPVRASDKSCLECHFQERASSIPMSSLAEESKIPGQKQKPLRIGDPLGVMLYAYERTSR